MTEFLYILALIVANVIQGITGFAGNVIAMPPAALLLGVGTARGALNLLSLASGIFLTVWFWRHIDWRALGKILLLIMPGIILGMAIYTLYPADELLVPYGVIVVGLGVWYLLGARETPLPRWVLGLLILGAGLMQGMFVSGGPLLVVYAATILRDKERFRATLSALWLVLNLIIFCQSFAAGMVDQAVIDYTLIGLIPLILATIVGGLAQKRINQQLFMRIAYILLIVSGALLVFDALIVL